MAQRADAVVIGSGAFGASVALHLAKAGRRVVVLDRSDLTDETSPRAAGLTMQIHDDEPTTRLAMRSRGAAGLLRGR